MIRIDLSDGDREAIAEELDDPEIDMRIRHRLMTVRLHDLKVPHQAIAQALNLCEDTVTNYLKLYRDGGLAGLLEDRYYRPTSSVHPWLEDIAQSFEQNPVSTANEGAARIQQISGIRLSDAQARRIMIGLGLKFRKTAAVPGGADPQLQFDFLTEELLPRLEEARQGRGRVFFVDAAHFVLGSFLGMIWSFTRIFVPSASGRQRYNVLGAVETRDHDFVSIRTTDSINEDVVCDLLMKIHKAYGEEPITLVMDNARYQRSRLVVEVAAALGIELLYLPPYSPNLNLIERVWRLVKARCLRNKYFETFALFKGAIDAYLDSLSKANRKLLQTLLTENFQLFENPKN
jgi:transposase